MMSQKRLQLLQNHICANTTAGASGAPASKALISAQIIKDGGKEYPEIIDYHPEKKVSQLRDQLQEAIIKFKRIFSIAFKLIFYVYLLFI